MLDKKALQAGTSHELGQNFSKAFEIEYSDENNKLQNPFQTSWGVSTRLIGMIIMAHGDDKGLKLPPNLAPIQVVIVPIIPSKDDKNKVMENVENIKTMLSNYRLSIDDREEVTPGYKFNEWELKGVPIRIEIGPRDIENNKVILSRRDIDNSKEEVSIEKLKSTIDQLIIDIQNNMFDISKKHMEENTIHVDTKEDLIEALNNKEGFVTCYWSENKDDELEIKELTSATIRCYPINNEETKQSINDKKDGKFAIFSKAY